MCLTSSTSLNLSESLGAPKISQTLFEFYLTHIQPHMIVCHYQFNLSKTVEEARERHTREIKREREIKQSIVEEEKIDT